MSKAHKRITLVLSITLIITLLGGCGMINIYDEKKLQENAIKYMEKKYDEEFTIRNCGAGDTTYNFRMVAEAHKDWEDVYVIWVFKKNKYIDNYMSWYFRDELSQQFQTICQEVYPKCVTVNIPFGAQATDEYKRDTTLEEYMSTVGIIHYNVFVLDDSNQKEEKLQQLRVVLNEENQDVYLRIIYVNQDVLESVDGSTYKDILADENYTWRGQGYIKKDELSSDFEWREVN